MVDKDRSIQGFIDAGHERLEPLAEFRDWLKEFSRNNSNRMTERRNGQDGMGPFTFTARKVILKKLLAIQKLTQMSLISSAEISMIEKIWRDDESLVVKNRANRILSMMEPDE